MHFIEKFKEGDRISDVYLCKSRSTALTKTGKEYDNVILQDKTGQIDSKIWDLNSGGIDDFDVMDYVAITGQVTSFNGALQLKIDRARKAGEGEYIAILSVNLNHLQQENRFIMHLLEVCLNIH